MREDIIPYLIQYDLYVKKKRLSMFDCGSQGRGVLYWCGVGDRIRIFRLSSNCSLQAIQSAIYLHDNNKRVINESFKISPNKNLRDLSLSKRVIPFSKRKWRNAGYWSLPSIDIIVTRDKSKLHHEPHLIP